MPILGNALDFAQLEGRNFRAHQLGAAPTVPAPVRGQVYFNTGDNTLYWYDGTVWVSSRGAGDATTSSKGIIQLAGDLAGTAALPQIAAGVIVDADVNSGAAIAESKLSLATDAAVGTGSRRTLGTGAQQAMPGNYPLDIIAASNPASGPVDLNNKRLMNVATPTANGDAATKGYADSVAQGFDAKASVAAASIANVTLPTTTGTQIDGVTLAATSGVGRRVLLKNQTAPAENGIYYVVSQIAGTSFTLARALDMDTWAEVPSSYVWVEEGTVNADTCWVCTSDLLTGGVLRVIGTDAMTWRVLPSVLAIGTAVGAALPGSATLDQVTAPAADVSINSKRLLNVANPGSLTDAANKFYVDTSINTASWASDAKPSVKAATTANIANITTIQAGGTFDGVTCTAGDRLLVKNQTNPAENGIWIVNVADYWGRAPDADSWTEHVGAYVWVEQGTTQADTHWVCTVDAGGTLGTTAVTWRVVPSLLATGSGVGAAMPGSTTLDQVPTAVNNVDLNGRKITSMADPTASTDAATKLYVDNTAQGLDVKASVKMASDSNIASMSGTAGTMDGITLQVGDRVLVKDQSSQYQNGIYVIQSGAWTRAPDMLLWAQVPGSFVFVEQGALQADTGWVCTADQGGTMNSTAMPWAQFSGAGAIVDGDALLRTGNRLDVRPDLVGIEVVADKLQLKDGGVTGAKIANSTIDPSTKFSAVVPVGSGGTGANNIGSARTTLQAAGYYSSATHGAGTTITITQATHGCRASRGLIVQVRDEATGAFEIPDHTVAANGDVTVTYGASVSANSKRVTILG